MRKLIFLIFIQSLLFWSHCSNQNRMLTPLPYFNQPAPGLKPELFAPGFFSNQDFVLHGFPTFSPDGKEVYWPVVPPKVLWMEYVDHQWSSPQIAPFSEGNIQAACFSQDGSKLFFQLYDSTGYGDLDMWFVEKIDSAWSPKINIGSSPNSSKMESQPSVAKNGTVYFTGSLDNVTWNRGIYRSEYQNGKYLPPEVLPPSINTEFIDYTPFIAPDESFLLFASTRPTHDEEDIRIYVSFRKKNNTRSEPVNLNEVMDFNQPSRFPSLTPDGKFMIFLSKGEYYWVSSEVIEKCREGN